MRALHRDVLRLACALHPSHRVADHLAQGLASKSNRTKIECCGEGAGWGGLVVGLGWCGSGATKWWEEPVCWQLHPVGRL